MSRMKLVSENCRVEIYWSTCKTTFPYKIHLALYGLAKLL